MPTSTARKRATVRKAPDAIDYAAEIVKLVTELRERDTDPAFADAPVLHSYARISKVNRMSDDEKPERQTYDNLREIKRRGERLGEILIDRNRSAHKKDGKRPAFDRLKALLEARVGNGVMLWHTDRLLRQMWDLGVLIRLADSGAYTIASCNGTKRLDIPEDRLFLHMAVAVAEYDSAQKAIKINRAMQHLRDSGQRTSGALPFGHAGTARPNVSDAQLAEERMAVAWGVQAIVDGESLGSVAKEWNARGLRTTRGLTWNPLNVRQCIVLPTHAGMATDRDSPTGLRRLADVDPIISETLYQTLMAVFAGRKLGGRRPAQGVHFASTVLRCGVCNTRLVGTTEPAQHRYPDGSPRRGYRCTPKGCRSVSIDARVAEQWLYAHMVEALSAPGRAEAVTQRSTELATVDAEIARREAILRDAADNVAADLNRWERYKRMEADIERDLTTLRERREALVAAGGSDATARELNAASIEALWKTLPAAERRAMVLEALPYGAIVAPANRAARPCYASAYLRLTLPDSEV
jgi:site-specific DNA recombinase